MNTKIKMPIMITMKEYRLVGLLFLLINSRVIIEMSQVKKKLKANGTAIGVVCVTGAANRLLVPFVGRELSRWQAGMARYLRRRVRLVLRSRYMTNGYK